jgi:hypothetical protein
MDADQVLVTGVQGDRGERLKTSEADVAELEVQLVGDVVGVKRAIDFDTREPTPAESGPLVAGKCHEDLPAATRATRVPYRVATIPRKWLVVSHVSGRRVPRTSSTYEIVVRAAAAVDMSRKGGYG